MRTFEAKKELERALSALSRDHSMGYLAVTSKPELPVRDRVAWHLHKRHSRFVVAREYTIHSDKNPKVKKKVDLAVLDPSRKPVVLVEFKAMIVPDPLRNRRHESMVSLREDLKRLAAIRLAPRIGVMLMVGVENCDQFKERGINGSVVKYMWKLCRNENDPNKATDIASNFFTKAGLNVTSLTVKLGSVWGASVTLICFILEPQGQKSNATLKRKIKRAQRLVRKYVKPGTSLVDELIAERRRESRNSL